MSRIVIAGGGFAGVWAAKAAARIRRQAGRAGEGVEIVLVAPGDDLVLRPRLYEPRPERMRVALDDVLAPLGVRRVRAEVADVDTGERRVALAGADGPLPYDRLVLATGSRVRKPALPGEGRCTTSTPSPRRTPSTCGCVRWPNCPRGRAGSRWPWSARAWRASSSPGPCRSGCPRTPGRVWWWSSGRRCPRRASATGPAR